tara:strand:+ start:15885 stop:16784 length:900 start_codon:yes stop_codon:yes gene_type:complete
MILKNRFDKDVSLENQYAGQSIFLCGSGPSLRNHDLHLLKESQAFTFGLNNLWSLIDLDFWTAMDPPEKFLSWGHMNPRIQKFYPSHHKDKYLRTKTKEDKFITLETTPKDCPNAYFFNGTLGWTKLLEEPSLFFTLGEVNWGSDKKHDPELKNMWCRSSLLPAFRIIEYLGFTKIYLIGCDFKMNTSTPYAFGQMKQKVGGNNAAYVAQNKMLKALYPEFLARDVHIYNCTKESYLNVFPYFEYEKALEECAHYSREDTEGWYHEEINRGVVIKKGAYKTHQSKIITPRKERMVLQGS